MTRLTRAFFRRDALTLAPALLGCVITATSPEGKVSARIIETEAYMGLDDPAAHTVTGKPTPRTAIVFGDAGYAYTYLIYGMHWCLNIVANAPGIPHCVLIRALEPLSGTRLMTRRRHTDAPAAWCSGPGKLCAALGITGAQNGADLLAPPLKLTFGPPPTSVAAVPRVGIGSGPEAAWPWRFYDADSRFISRR